MGSEKEEVKKCDIANIVIPEEVRLTYFPNATPKLAYDILPLFEIEDYRRKLGHEVSILENPSNAQKWEEFRNGLPQSYLCLKPAGIDKSKIRIFANYRTQRVAPEYLATLIGPSSPEAIFRRTE